MMKNVYYKKKLVPTESGLEVITEKWVSVHETHCFDYCVHDYDIRGECIVVRLKRLAGTFKKNGMLRAAKQCSYTVKRIVKRGSRFAFATEKDAMDNLRYLKTLQLKHLQRDTEFIRTFLSCESVGDQESVIPNTRDLVHSYFNFEF